LILEGYALKVLDAQTSWLIATILKVRRHHQCCGTP
jgi:hypothetical protein